MKANYTLTRPERPVSPLAIYGPALIPVLIAGLLNMPRTGLITGDWAAYLRVFLNDTTLLNLTSLFYLFSSLCFAFYLFQKADVFNEKFAKLGVWLSIIGFTFHSTSFILRWLDVKRPPIGGINEVVLSFAWSLVLLNLIISQASKFRFMNFITMPFATVAALLATIFPTGRDVHLVPALQSYWIYIHVTMAAFAYPTFGLSFLLAILYLIKDRVTPQALGLGIMSLTVLILGVFDSGALITKASYSAPEFITGPFGSRALDVKVTLPGVGPLLSAALAAALVAMIAYLLAVAKKANSSALGFLAARVSLLLQLVGGAVLLYQISVTPRTSVSSIPFELTGLGLTILSIAFLWVLTRKQETIVRILPSADKLDTLIYRTITVGFPLLAGQLITGAIWAGESWGRYWGWDPKEVWALITWLIYAAYLHTRMTRGWTGRKNVYFALVGFASVMFTYLGVTYLLSGLHSYK